MWAVMSAFKDAACDQNVKYVLRLDENILTQTGIINVRHLAGSQTTLNTTQKENDALHKSPDQALWSYTWARSGAQDVAKFCWWSGSD